MARKIREMTPAERAVWERQVAAIEGEYRELRERFRVAEQATEEDSFSGTLRRAIYGIHGRGITLPTLLSQANVDWPTLDAFLHGEGLLSSDVIDRLVRVLGLHVEEVIDPGIAH